jgi:SAM-dependent methyltransferase
MDEGFPVEQIDTSKPHTARMYDYYLGGRDNYEVDREAAQRIIDLYPDAVVWARANRDFMQRAVRSLVHSGVRQIIDIGTGIPTSPNTHEIAHAVSKDVRVAYIDNDPIVATHAGARLLGTGNTGFFLADLRDPAGILEHPTLGGLIDFEQPVAVMLVSLLHFIKDDEDPAGLVAALRDALPAGSYLVLSHVTNDFHPKVAEVFDVYNKATASLTTRAYDEVIGFFDGFELLDPGLVQIPAWRPDKPVTPEEVARVGFYGAVARKV